MSAPARPSEGCALPPPGAKAGFRGALLRAAVAGWPCKDGRGRWSRSDRRAVQPALEARNRRTALKLAGVALALFLLSVLGHLA